MRELPATAVRELLATAVRELLATAARELLATAATLDLAAATLVVEPPAWVPLPLCAFSFLGSSWRIGTKLLLLSLVTSGKTLLRA